MDWRIVAGEFAAGIGAALLVGTGLALFRYWRTGRFPNQPEDAEPSLLGAWVKFAVGLALVVWGVATMDRAGLF